jgi:hypothetical protein
MTRSTVLTFALALTLAAAATAAPAARTRTLVVDVANAHFVPLSTAAADPGDGTDTVGPFFIVKGDVVGFNGRPARGEFICRGIVFTSKGAPLPFGVAQVSTSFDILGRGVLFGSGLEFRSGQPGSAVVGGTGNYLGARGTYFGAGAPVELGGDGTIRFTFELALTD